jgi:DNA adenine methylase
MKTRLKTPLPYHGGKTRMLPHILPLLPTNIEKLRYHECFVGGAALFWAKPPSVIEVLNDTNENLINFYKVIKLDFDNFYREVGITLHSKAQYQQAGIILAAPNLFDPVKRAWAYWVLITQSFGKKYFGGWGYDKSTGKVSSDVNSLKGRITEIYARRLENVQLECSDALDIIKSRDGKDSFFYLDPPYVGSDCGHYDGYTWADYETMLDQLQCLNGKFMLSSYPSPLLEKYCKANGWNIFSFDQQLSLAGPFRKLSRKTEILVTNYKN